MEYKDPASGAEQMFKTVMAYLEKHLISNKEVETSWRGNEHAQHEAFAAAKRSIYVGGQTYFASLDSFLTSGNFTVMQLVSVVGIAD